MYKVGIIGMSWIAWKAPDNHLDAYLSYPHIDPNVVTCDIDGFWDYRDYRDYLDMVKENELDIVSVCTPVETHCQIVCDVAPYVKAIYCEKPMATTLEECDKMIKACKDSDTILQINHQRRFIKPKFTFSREIIDTGTHAFDLLNKLFGKITMVSKDKVLFESGHQIEIEYINDMKEHIFNLDCVRSKEKMIALGVGSLIHCLDHNLPSNSGGYEGREALKWALEYKKLIQS